MIGHTFKRLKLKNMLTQLSTFTIDWKHFSALCSGDTHIMDEVAKMLIDEIPTELLALNTAVSQKNWGDVFDICHKLKTTVSFFGNTELNNIVKTMEFSAQHNVDTHLIVDLKSHCSDILNRIQGELMQSKNL